MIGISVSIAFLVLTISQSIAGAPSCSEADALAGCTAELLISLEQQACVYDIQKEVYFPILIQLKEHAALSFLPEYRVRRLSRGSYIAGYLTGKEIRELSTNPCVISIGLGGNAVADSNKAKTRLWPQKIRDQKSKTVPSVLLGIIDFNTRYSFESTGSSDSRILCQYVSSALSDESGAPCELSSKIHGIEVASLAFQMAPGAHFATYDTTRERLDIVIGLETIYSLAKSLSSPAIINLSASFQTGSHDGLFIWEKVLGDYVDDSFFIVTSGGNALENDVHIHVEGDSIKHDMTVDIPFSLDKTEQTTDIKINLWFKDVSPLRAQIIGLTDEILNVFPNQRTKYVCPQKTLFAAFVQNMQRVENSNVLVAMSLSPQTIQEGSFIIRLFLPENGRGGFVCDGWIDSRPESTVHCTEHLSTSGTIQSFACAKDIIAVSNFHKNADGKLAFHSLGPTRDGRGKPDVFVLSNSPTSYTTAIVSGLLAQNIAEHGTASPQEMLKAIASKNRWLYLPNSIFTFKCPQ
jgi:hypothetical protein